MKIIREDGATVWLLEKRFRKEIRTAVVVLTPPRLVDIGNGFRKATSETLEIKMVFASVIGKTANVDIIPVYSGNKRAGRKYWDILRNNGFNLSEIGVDECH